MVAVFNFFGLGRSRVGVLTAELLSPAPVIDRTCSVRTKIRNYEGNEYYYGKDFFPRCLFAGEKGNPNRVRDGYLQSTLLVKVSVVLYLP